MYLLAIIFPPLAVLLSGKPIQAIINIPLLLLGIIPAIIHALLVVSEYKKKQATKQITEAIKAR